jgi:hypothetical protein
MGHALTKEHIPTLFAAKVSPQTFFCEISKGYQAFYIKNTLGADYMESFQPGLSFIPVSRAEISARPKDKVLLKHSKRLHDQNSSPAACNRK